ncbi:flagellar biosynthetic protein FliP [Desulfobulbus propionicus DSM 2032]|jgi:flagellar biosynthetic protein FliP|uniref:Flagellar biosynthetic protein FliP n=1 Tax=Desulfobulbus propionicus (strain ATCC 33891 / DSM 2032 / VKM B-1956 / 1pr3) TaxID=577650 RepID=A0A7U3YN12_DESPD|nr:flagellar type III secretion system pore protein FliP [Desulfobulbus propionicus]ADW18380.1 flagellar biosynthetic protein FliP [Desulfobulbus propionicus DSM 2032]
MKGFAFVFALVLLLAPTLAAAVNLPTLSLGIKEAATPAEVSTALQALLVLTILTVAPAILLMTTAFTRIVIVLSFVRQAMGTQNTPPNQVLLGLALFLTFFVMAPSLNAINDQALQPYIQEKITQQQALERSMEVMRDFMFSQVQESELQLFIDITKEEQPADKKAVSSSILIPAFMLSELKRAFQMGFMIYVPFLVIDMLVSSVLMSMGMMMLPPIVISLPFKLLLFVLVDGWQLVVGSLMKSFG